MTRPGSRRPNGRRLSRIFPRAARHPPAHCPLPPQIPADSTSPFRSDSTSEASTSTGKRLAFLSLTALGIVYGDIGTSPLYALQQVFNSKEHAAIALTRANVYGVLSLIVWLLILVVAVKYIIFIMRADNRGEGGILALMALILQKERRTG